MGFITNPVKIGIDMKIKSVWDTCRQVNEPMIKAQSLFNFMCSLLSIEFMSEAVLIKMKDQIDRGSDIYENTYGYIIKNEFYLKFDLSAKQQKQL